MDTNLFFTSDREGSIGGLRIHHALSLDKAGNMADTYENNPGDAKRRRIQFYKEAGFGDYKIVRMIPVYGTKMMRVDGGDEGRELRCDSLITTDRKVALATCAADCYTAIIFPRDLRWVRMLHISAQNLDQGIIEKAMVNIQGRSLSPIDVEHLFVGIGPGICANCYDAPWIGEQLGTEDTWKDFLFLDEDGRVHCNLRGAILDKFLKCGVQEKNMRIARECTCCSRYPDRSYLLASHHRAKTSGPEERFLVVAALARPSFSLRRFFGRSFFTVQP